MNYSSIEAIGSAQNSDGGWPYQVRKGGSWTEPTVYALLARQANRDFMEGVARAQAWLKAAQRPDGGWPPRPSVDQSTWVTALVALLPPETIGAERHAAAVTWLLGQSGMESKPGFRLKEFLTTGRQAVGANQSGWPWFPGTSAWVTPTCLGILALDKCHRRKPATDLQERVSQARAFLLAHRCADGGWNHGSTSPLGYNCDSYPETTGQALLALRGTDPSRLQSSFAIARRFLEECRTAGGATWLRLGLQAHAQLPAGTPIFDGRCHTVADAGLLAIARAAGQGSNVFLDIA